MILAAKWQQLSVTQVAAIPDYYVRGEQSDGEVVWVSPMWITYTGK